MDNSTEKEENFNNIYYFKLDDDRFHRYKSRKFEKLEISGLTFNELYRQEFFKMVKDGLKIEVSKETDNEKQSEKQTVDTKIANNSLGVYNLLCAGGGAATEASIAYAASINILTSIFATVIVFVTATVL
ncbi:MAG: hypothetical protein PV340_04420 [Wolbachia sp.]|nr:hypothetical protein [Wolbachia sp.]MDD9336069.1 hypothetical protein [Wolbachia sp.]